MKNSTTSISNYSSSAEHILVFVLCHQKNNKTIPKTENYTVANYKRDSKKNLYKGLGWHQQI